MSIVAARKRLVDTVSAVKPLSKARGLGEGFVHDPRGGGDVIGAMRTFHLRMVAGAFRGPVRVRATSVRLVCDLVVEYASFADRVALDVAVVEDFAEIALALSSSENWHADETGIRIVGGDNATDLFTMAVEEPKIGVTRLRIRFPLEVRHE